MMYGITKIYASNVVNYVSTLFEQPKVDIFKGTLSRLKNF